MEPQQLLQELKTLLLPLMEEHFAAFEERMERRFGSLVENLRYSTDYLNRIVDENQKMIYAMMNGTSTTTLPSTSNHTNNNNNNASPTTSENNTPPFLQDKDTESNEKDQQPPSLLPGVPLMQRFPHARSKAKASRKKEDASNASKKRKTNNSMNSAGWEVYLDNHMQLASSEEGERYHSQQPVLPQQPKTEVQDELASESSVEREEKMKMKERERETSKYTIKMLAPSFRKFVKHEDHLSQRHTTSNEKEIESVSLLSKERLFCDCCSTSIPDRHWTFIKDWPSDDSTPPRRGRPPKRKRDDKNGIDVGSRTKEEADSVQEVLEQFVKKRDEETGNTKSRKGRKFRSRGGGSTCHQCHLRQPLWTTCNCGRRFCSKCLAKYEDTVENAKNVNWCCPFCRRICTCAACRRSSHAGAGPVNGPSIASSSNASSSSVLDTSFTFELCLNCGAQWTASSEELVEGTGLPLRAIMKYMSLRRVIPHHEFTSTAARVKRLVGGSGFGSNTEDEDEDEDTDNDDDMNDEINVRELSNPEKSENITGIGNMSTDEPENAPLTWFQVNE